MSRPIVPIECRACSSKIRTKPSAKEVMFTWIAAILLGVDLAYGHGQLQSPRSRNWYARQEGLDWGRQDGVPLKEYCFQCLNRNAGVCGSSSPSRNYDEWLDSNGQAMPWISQAQYTEGDTIDITAVLETHHSGHMEFKACPLGRETTWDCLDQYPLTFVADLTTYDMPADPAYPERGYLAGWQDQAKEFNMQFQLPAGLAGEEILLQWRYITANSCTPPGYSEYYGGANARGIALSEANYQPLTEPCRQPYPLDGSVDEGAPEQFFNCAEVSITPKEGNSPTVYIPRTKPPMDAPVETPAGEAPAEAPSETNAYGVAYPCCGWDGDCRNPNSAVSCHANCGQCTRDCNGVFYTAPGVGTSDCNDATNPSEEEPVEPEPVVLCCPPGFTGSRTLAGCGGFHFCSDGQVVGNVNLCSGGLLFDRDGGICDWPYNFECAADPADCGDAPPVAGEEESSSPFITVPCCPLGFTGFRSLTDCSGFHYCADGAVVGIATVCPGGTLYNSATGICDWDYNVECTTPLEPCIPPTAAPTEEPTTSPTSLPLASPVAPPSSVVDDEPASSLGPTAVDAATSGAARLASAIVVAAVAVGWLWTFL